MAVIRCIAAATALGTLFIVTADDHPAEFLIPDLLLAMLLLAGSALPRRYHVHAVLLGGFAFAAGVFAVAFTAAVVDDATNWLVGGAAVICASGAVATAAARRPQVEARSG